MARVPGDADEPFRYFGLLTWKDMVRLGVPLGVMWFVAQGIDAAGYETAVILFTGWLLSALWYLWQPYDDPVEMQLYHMLRWILGRVIP